MKGTIVSVRVLERDGVWRRPDVSGEIDWVEFLRRGCVDEVEWREGGRALRRVVLANGSRLFLR